MRRYFLMAVVSVSVLAACVPHAPPSSDVDAWQGRLEHVTPASQPPALVRSVLNTAIRAGVPVVCPALSAQAATAYRLFVTATCAAIVASTDPFTSLTTTLPALCAGDPPVGASVFPNLKPVLIATCPLLVQLPALLNVAQYVPVVGPVVGPA